jgi:hypothetical protein
VVNDQCVSRYGKLGGLAKILDYFIFGAYLCGSLFAFLGVVLPLCRNMTMIAEIQRGYRETELSVSGRPHLRATSSVSRSGRSMSMEESTELAMGKLRRMLVRLCFFSICAQILILFCGFLASSRSDDTWMGVTARVGYILGLCGSILAYYATFHDWKSRMFPWTLYTKIMIFKLAGPSLPVDFASFHSQSSNTQRSEASPVSGSGPTTPMTPVPEMELTFQE